MGGKKNMNAPNTFAGGGTVDVMASDGEFIVSPDDVINIAGKGDQQKGHSVLNEFIKMIRKNHISKLQKLPGPVET
jgi:hypothetical protein